MDKKNLQEAFRAWKKMAQADYAITAPDSLGDCMSCVNAALCDKYGEDSKGIWAKAWKYGMNGGTDLANEDCVYIAHDITEKQAKVFYGIFRRDYNIIPATYDASKCFILYEKGVDVYEVSYKDTWNGQERIYTERYTSWDKAARRMIYLAGDCGREVSIKRLFTEERGR